MKDKNEIRFPNWPKPPLTYEEVKAIEDTQRRGYEFEKLIDRYFRTKGIDSIRNPKAVRGRQIDLGVGFDNKAYLVELRWRKKKTGLPDMKDFRDKLNEIPISMNGIFISMSGFAKGAILDAENNRKRMILLFDKDDIESMLNENGSIFNLIKMKESNLMLNQKSWFSGKKQRKIAQLPMSESKTKRPEIVSKTAGDIVYTFAFPELPIGYIGGNGIGVLFDLSIRSISELQELFEMLHHLFKLSSNGSYSISMLDTTWHGFGINEFIKSLKRRDERYKECRLKKIHHSEYISYFDYIEGGWIYIYLRQHASEELGFDIAQMEMRVPGVPLNVAPFIELARNHGEYGHSYFQPIDRREYFFIRMKGNIEVSPIEMIETTVDKEHWACGVVVENPFKNANAPKNLVEKTDSLGALFEQDIWVCRMSDYHPLDKTYDKYIVKFITGTSTSWEPVINVGVTYRDE